MKIKKMKFEKKGLQSFLSPLESDVMKILWSGQKMRVRKIHEKIKRKKKVALTSVAVILDRLHKKGVVNREVEKGRGGLHYIYFPKGEKSQFERSIVESTVNKLINTFGSSAVTYFHERFSKKEEEKHA